MASLAGKLSGGNVRYAATPAPTFTSITPDHGPSTGGTPLVILGTNLRLVNFVTIGGKACTITATDATHVYCLSPEGAVGAAKTLIMRHRGGSKTQASAYTFDSEVAITAVDPAEGAVGEHPVTITGTGLLHAVSVTFGGDEATEVVVIDDETITCVTPVGALGAVDVVVDSGDFGTDTLTDGYEYINEVDVLSILPVSGPVMAETSVTITGTGFLHAEEVTFGGVPATDMVVVNDTTITCNTPASPFGGDNVVDVVVDAGAYGQDTLADGFEFLSTIVLTSLSPAFGPGVGGTAVTLTGSGFLNATAAYFDLVPATDFVVVNDTTATCTTPAGTENVEVAVSGGDYGEDVLVDGFLYVTPLVGEVTPADGPQAGGTAVTVSGSGFTAAVSVKFAGVLADDFVVVNDTTITCTTPAGAAPIPVTVRVDDSFTQFGLLPNGFTYT